MHVERIKMDSKFSTNIISKLKDFYFTAVLPVLSSPQAKIREPEEWITDEWKETHIHLDS